MQNNHEQITIIRRILPMYQNWQKLSYTVRNWEEFLGYNWLSDEQFMQNRLSQNRSGCLFVLLGFIIFFVGFFICQFFFILLSTLLSELVKDSSSQILNVLIVVINCALIFGVPVFLAIFIPIKIRKGPIKKELVQYRALRENFEANHEKNLQLYNGYKNQQQQLYNSIMSSPDNIIPFQYWSYAAYLLEILEQGRAFDVGSALNLIKQEQWRQEIVNQANRSIEENRQFQAKMTDMLRDIKSNL